MCPSPAAGRTRGDFGIAGPARITSNDVMRIIAGEHRGRVILGPRGASTTRPMTDRVKESLFNRLKARDVLHGEVLDLFAGTGSLGLETLSRGADHCTFIERDRSAVELLHRNLQTLGLESRATVRRMNALSASWAALVDDRMVRLVLCDPPYRMTEHDAGLHRITVTLAALAVVVEPGGLLMLRTPRATAVDPIEGWEGPESHLYGSMRLAFFQREG